MGRPKRCDQAGYCYHMLNRANMKATIFQKDADYQAFESLLVEAIERFNLDLFAYCILPNHWHMVVRPNVDGEMGRFSQWVGLTHTQRYHAHYQTTGFGHVYQGRYKSFPVQCDDHFLTVCRYVERNAFAADLSSGPETWKWGSQYHWANGDALSRQLLSPWPIRRRPGWTEWTRTDFSKEERTQLDWSRNRGVPFGDETWVESTARKFQLESTMRPRGRPRKEV